MRTNRGGIFLLAMLIKVNSVVLFIVYYFGNDVTYFYHEKIAKRAYKKNLSNCNYSGAEIGRLIILGRQVKMSSFRFLSVI